MSLRTFHLVFVGASVILALGLGAWGIDAYRARGDASALILALLGFLFGAAFAVYGFRVRTKLKGLGLR
jgi:hypothetical protein